MKEPKIIFLYSQSPRSGHNFVAEVIRKVVKCNTPIGERSEIPLAPILKDYLKAIKSYYKSVGGDDYLNDLLLGDLRKKIINNNGTCLMKYTSFMGANESLSIFKDDLHIVSLRDPKDCLLSLFKGMKEKKGMKSILKKILKPTGIYHYSYARKYAKRVELVLPDLNNFNIIKYESLVLKESNELQRLIHLFHAEITVEELSRRIDEIQVINTSFYKEETNAKGIWDASVKTKSFNSINRRKGFNKLQLFGIDLGSKSLRKKLGYIQ